MNRPEQSVAVQPPQVVPQVAEADATRVRRRALSIIIALRGQVGLMSVNLMWWVYAYDSVACVQEVRGCAATHREGGECVLEVWPQ